MGRLHGKVAVCTGSARGFGRAIVEAFAREGAHVWATDIDSDALKELEGIHGITTEVLDVTNSEEVKTFGKKIPKVDILCNCSGKFQSRSFFQCDETELDDALASNVKSVFIMTKEFLPKMMSEGKGSIINIASVASSIQGYPNHFAFGTAKAAVIGLTKSLAADLKEVGITVNAICPDTVENPSLIDLVQTSPKSPQEKAAFVGGHRFGRFGTMEEVTAIALLLASDEGRRVTGTTPIIRKIEKLQELQLADVEHKKKRESAKE